MRYRTLRLPLMSFTVLSMVAMAGALLVEQSLQHRRAEIAAARTTYLLAIAETKAQLLNSLGKVTSDSSLVQNMNWTLQHSVKGNLEGKLQKGALDQIALVGRGCNEIGHAAFNHMVAIPCPFEAPVVSHQDEVFWTSPKGVPIIALAHGLTGLDGNEIIAVGAVQLDDQWLGMHSDLSHAIDKLGLQISDSNGIALAEPALDLGSAPMATLRSSNYMDRFILTATNKNLFLSNIVFWPCLCLALACLLAAMGRERATRLAAVRALSDFVNWCRKLTPSSDTILAAINLSEKTPLNISRKLISHALQLKTDALSTQEHKRHVLSEQVTKQEDELQKLRSRLTELAELDSLAIQLQHTTGSFLRQMDQFRSETDDLTAGVLCSLKDHCQSLRAFSDDWRHGINNRGARKFIRGLAESQSIEEDGLSELDRHLTYLIDICSEISDLTRHATQIGHKLITQANVSARLAGLWHGLSLKTNEAELCESLQQPIDEAQMLVRLAPGLQPSKFINPTPEGNSTPKFPELPKTAWVSALYHIYLTLAELARASNSNIISRLRSDGEKTLLIVQVASHAGADSPKRSDKQAYHLDIARAILAPFQVGVSVLPAVDGPYPVVLSWSTLTPYRHNVPGQQTLIQGAIEAPELVSLPSA